MARRADTATRARRMLALLPLLKRGEPVPITELAHAVGCPAEDVAADLAALTMCGVPPFSPSDMIELDIDGDTVTVYVEPPALDRPLKLTPAEARALLAALEAAGHEPTAPLPAKLLAAASGSVSTEELERTVRAGATPGGTAAIQATLASAVETRTALRITYFTASTGRTSERVVEPLSFAARLGAWYLVAHCRSAGEERVFRLDRIRSAEPTGERFEIRTGVSSAVTPPTGELPVAEIRFSSGSGLPTGDEWPGARFESQTDGSTLVRVGYQSVDWLARRIVARLGDAEALAPPEVREAVRALSARILNDLG